MSTILPSYEPYANAKLTVKLASAPYPWTGVNGWVRDSQTGNMVPSQEPIGLVDSPVYEVSYRCHLHLSRNPRLNRAAGVNSTTFALEGMLLSPREFDEMVAPNQVFDAQYNEVHGEFELLPEHSVLPEFRSFLGTRITGIFRMSGPGQPTPLED